MKKILICEDEEIVRESVAGILRHENYEVFSAENGEIGFKLAKKLIPDLILSDIAMPKLDGYGLIKRIKSDKLINSIPIIIISILKKKAERRQAYSLGADDFLAKPFTIDELLESINRRFEALKEVKRKQREELLNFKNNFSYTLPHEFKTPLNGIIGPVKLLKEEIDNLEKKEIVSYLDVIDNSAKRLNDLVTNFLNFSELNLISHIPDEIKKFRNSITNNTNDIIRKSAITIANDYNRKEDLEFKIENETIKINKEHFARLLSEVIKNAFKFSEKGDTVSIMTYKDDEYFKIRIIDRGIGFLEKQIAEIDLYQQFDRNIKEQQGVGLGLSITKKILEIYGGKMEFGNSPKIGTSVTLFLPISQ